MKIKEFLDQFNTLHQEEKLMLCRMICDHVLSNASRDHLLAEQNKFFSVNSINDKGKMEEYQKNLVNGVVECLKIEMGEEGKEFRRAMELPPILETDEILPND